jgi:predicted nucleotide-binding protein (sugar kinase/HSP70/actin superfamily)
MCLPFKTVLGDFIQGLEHGADVILFGGGCGQCRLSYYGDLQQEILRDMGYKFKYIHLNLSHITYLDVYRKLSPVLEDSSKLRIARAVTSAAKTVFAVDKLYALAGKIRCREIKKGSTDHIMEHFEKTVQEVHGYHNIRNAINEAHKNIRNIAIDNEYLPLKIALIGEIFISSDPFTNLDIEQKLGNMGVEVTNSMSVSGWIREHFIHALMPIKPKDKSVEAAQEYMHTDDIGGHGIYTIGNAELMSRGDYDGIVHIYPFTCMPEIIAQSTFSFIQDKYDIPIMTLIVDELTAEAGYITRLEAFVDMLRMRKEHNENEAKVRQKLRHA